MKINQFLFPLVLAIGATSMPSEVHGQTEISKAEPASKEVSKEVSPDQKHWFQGNVAEAYTAAAKEKKHMILYWGAEWCPPCNDLKDQVFSHPEFPIFASRYIMVYLDGDSEGAQTWGEKLKVSGYPTVVLMDPKGKELFRFSSGMDFSEFKRSMTSAVASGKNFKSIVSNLNGSKPKLTLEDWQTLSTSYMDQDALGLDDLGTEKLIEKSWLLCPADFALGKATFAASLWDHSLGEKSKLKETFKKNEELILEQILSSGTAMDAARNSLMMEPAKKIESLKPENKERVRQRMVTYMKDLATSPSRAPSERAMALHSFLDLETLASKSSADTVKSDTVKSEGVQTARVVNESLKKEVQVMMDSILQAANTSHQMASTFPEIASIIEQLSGPKDAVLFLESKIPGAKTPWYFESMLASLENTLGNKEKALSWSEKAKNSSKGSATRLQWISRDVALRAKILEKTDPKITLAIEEFLAESKSQGDKFEGRNASAHKRVAAVIKDLGKNSSEMGKKVSSFCQKNNKCLSLYSGSPTTK
jgi:protein disulfide-isomerase